jgi:hypothetical protein
MLLTFAAPDFAPLAGCGQRIEHTIAALSTRGFNVR